MKKVISIALAGAAVFALSGCATGDGDGGGNNEWQNTGDDSKITIRRQAAEYVAINDPNKTCVEVKNSALSDFSIDQIWSAPLSGSYNNRIYPNGTPPNEIVPGESRTFCSAQCGENRWKIKIADTVGTLAEGQYERQCGYKELLLVEIEAK